MREAYKAKIIRNEHGLLQGVYLGADFCAEHEHGIKYLKSICNLDDSQIGVERRRIRNLDEKVLHSSTCKINKQEWYYISINLYDINPNSRYFERTFSYCNRDAEIITAWDDSGFIVLVKNQKVIEQLKKAIQDGNAAIGLFGGGVFENSGLGVYIISNLGDNIISKMKSDDEDVIKLKEASDKTGIHDYLTSKGMKWYALSPGWNNVKKKTNYPVIYWLNPYNQDIHNYGWFTVEDLRDWADNNGPVMMKKVS